MVVYAVEYADHFVLAACGALVWVEPQHCDICCSVFRDWLFKTLLDMGLYLVNCILVAYLLVCFLFFLTFLSWLTFSTFSCSTSTHRHLGLSDIIQDPSGDSSPVRCLCWDLCPLFVYEDVLS